MGAIEKLETAITRLELLRDEASPGNWVEATSGYAVNSRADGSTRGEWVLGDCARDEDATLVVTLHRTIAVQLKLLRAGLKHVKWQAEHAPDHVPSGIPLDLASAILGEI